MRCTTPRTDEQVGRQAERADPLELGDLRKQRRQPRAPRIALHLGQQADGRVDRDSHGQSIEHHILQAVGRGSQEGAGRAPRHSIARMHNVMALFMVSRRGLVVPADGSS
jgi:hypothetical protein